MDDYTQLISYIAHAAPATRRAATGNETYLRPEIGFTPRWYSVACGGIDFGPRWHTDPGYRADDRTHGPRGTRRRFGNRISIGAMQDPEHPADLLTGTFGALMVPALYGVPIWWQESDWPWSEHGQHLTDDKFAGLEPPDLDNNAFWQAFLETSSTGSPPTWGDWRASSTGRASSTAAIASGASSSSWTWARIR